MNDKLISIKAAIEALDKEKPTPFIDKDGNIDPFGAGRQNQWYRDGIAIMNLPFTQSERKIGKWIKMSDADGVYWVCSECGEEIPRVDDFDPQYDLFPRLRSIKKTNYCPHCGTEMETNDDEVLGTCN